MCAALSLPLQLMDCVASLPQKSMHSWVETAQKLGVAVVFQDGCLCQEGLVLKLTAGEKQCTLECLQVPLC